MRWAEIEPLLRKATALNGCYETIDLMRAAMIGRMGIWIAERHGIIDAAMVTEIMTYPRKRLLNVLFIGGGNLWGWSAEFVRMLDHHKRETGCAQIIAIGRRGWARFGFNARGVDLFVRD